MTYRPFIALVVYTNPITGEVFTHNVFPYEFKSRTIHNQFIINYSDKKLVNKFLFSEHCKVTSYLDLEDLEDYDFGVIKNLIDCSCVKEYYSPYKRIMLTLLYRKGLSGVSLN